MKIFLSWSGNRSRGVALALRNWLPLVLHYADPWMSQRDISAGERWLKEVGDTLETTSFGIVCLTRENLSSPWILFESGALSKSVDDSAVIPYLLGVEFSDLAGPLAQFQAKKSDKSSTLDVIQAINLRARNPVDAERVAGLFDALWPKLEQELSKLASEPSPDRNKTVRSQHEILEELVVAVRALEQRVAASATSAMSVTSDDSSVPAAESIRRYPTESEIREALATSGGSHAKASQSLGVSRQQLLRLMRRYDLRNS